MQTIRQRTMRLISKLSSSSQSYTFLSHTSQRKSRSLQKSYASPTALKTDPQTTEKNNEDITAATQKWRHSAS
jgi:type IV secretory pathway component VirB8